MIRWENDREVDSIDQGYHSRRGKVKLRSASVVTAMADQCKLGKRMAIGILQHFEVWCVALRDNACK